LITPAHVKASVLDLRVYPWLVGWEMFREYPIFGVGPGRFYQLFEFYRQRVSLRPTNWYWQTQVHENAHNYYVQVAAEAGGIGIALLLLFLVRILWNCEWSVPLASGAGLAVVGVAAVSLAQHPLLVEPLLLTFAVVCGLASRHEPEQRSAGRIRWVAAGGLLVLVAVHISRAYGVMPARFEYGIYGVEKGSRDFRWTSKLALLRRPWIRPEGSPVANSKVNLYVSSSNPEILNGGVRVSFDRDGQKLSDLTLHDNGWYPVELNLSDNSVLAIRSEKTFRPPGDGRVLGAAISGLPAQ
jgi:hypothetical protein